MVATRGSDDERTERGRLLFTKPWTFWRGAPSLETLPPIGDDLEVAFAGRSNVGKSSLINALVGQKQLARTSNTPGRTQELNFFHVEPTVGLRLVDMPGYGYAQAPDAVVRAWTRLIGDYLRGRSNLARVYVLIDARHGLKPVDEAILDTLDSSAVSYQIVLTKADQVKVGRLAALETETLARIIRRAAAFPALVATSSRDGFGMPDLRAAIADLLAERQG